METTVTRRGQTNIPAAIRRRHDIKEGDRITWLDDGETIRIVPVPADPISALRGSGRGHSLLDALLSERQKDRERDFASPVSENR
jgi:AbrB family looped-hinge helix DNA binding protein